MTETEDESGGGEGWVGGEFSQHPAQEDKTLIAFLLQPVRQRGVGEGGEGAATRKE